ncbi:hypothetical protein TNCV_1905991 [Trichonephila clavipes]|nr:hypothetical protein TNCV_1905991 [Trichonephila clavipes]
MYLGSLPVKLIKNHTALTRLTNGKNVSSRMIRWILKLAEFNVQWEHRSGPQNAVTETKLPRNLVPDHQEEKCKPKGDQSGPEENGSRSQARIARIKATGRSSNTRVAKSRGTDDPAVKVQDEVETPDSKSARR